MAEPTEKQFSDLIAAQKETTRQLMSVEESAAADAAVNEKNQNRIAGGIQAAETRAANRAEGSADDDDKSQSLLGKIAGGITDIFSSSKGSATSEKEKKNEELASSTKERNLLGKIAGGITGMREDAKDKMKAAGAAAGKGIMAILKATLVAGALLAVVAFLDSEYWVKTKKFILDKVIPILKELFEFLKDNWGKIIAGILIVKAVLVGMKVVALFKKIKAAYLAVKALTIKSFLDPLKDMLKGAWTKILATWGLIKKGFLALKAATIANVLEPLQLAVKNAAAGVWAKLKLIPPALVALKVFFLSTFLPAVTAFMVPLLPIIAIVAAISLVLWSLFGAFSDAQDTFEETGSITEALKVGISKFIGTLLGFIPDLVLKLVGWVAGLFGFDDFKKKVQAVNVSEWIADTVYWLLQDVIGWFKLLFSDPMAALKSLWTGILGGFKSLTDILFWPVNKAIAWVQKLFGWGDPAEPFTVQGFIAGVWEKVKCWFTSLLSWAAEEDSGDSWLVKTVKDMITSIKEWFDKMFDFGTLKSSLASIINIVLWLPNLVKDAVASVGAWLLGLFGFDKAAEKVANAKNWTIGGLIMDVVDSVVKWLKGLFSWGKKAGTTAAGDFSIWKMITGVFKSIKKWFSDTFSFDFSGLLDSLPEWIKDPKAAVMRMIKSLTKFLPSWLGGPDKSEADLKKEAEELAAAQKKKKEDELKHQLALREKAAKNRENELADIRELIAEDKAELAGGDTRVGADWTGIGQKREDRIKESDAKLLKLIAQNEKAKALDMEFKKKATTKSKDSSIFTHDQGLHDRLDKIFPTAVSGQRAAAMSQAALERQAATDYGGGGTTSINTGGNVVSSPTTNYVNNGTAARRPIILAA